MTVEQLQDGMDELDPVEAETALVTAPVVDVERRIEMLAGVPEVEPDGPLVETATEAPAVAELATVKALVAIEEPPSGEALPASTDSLVAFESPVAAGVSVWPFVAYDAVWLVFAGLVTWQLLEVPSGVAVYDAQIYPLVLVAGLVLTATGPAVVFASWFAARERSDEGPGQLLVSALLRGAVATSIGVALWWSVLIAVDRVRLGSFF